MDQGAGSDEGSRPRVKHRNVKLSLLMHVVTDKTPYDRIRGRA